MQTRKSLLFCAYLFVKAMNFIGGYLTTTLMDWRDVAVVSK